MRAKTELAKYCPIKIKKITLIAKAPKKIFLTIGLAGFFNQFIFKSTHHPTNRKRTFFSNTLRERGMRVIAKVLLLTD